jgi:hypothetical protein
MLGRNDLYHTTLENNSENIIHTVPFVPTYIRKVINKQYVKASVLNQPIFAS